MPRSEMEALIRRVYDLRAAGDVDGMLDCFGPGARYVVPGNAVHCAAAGAFRGDSLRQAFEALCRLYPAAGLEVLTLVIDGDRAAVRVLASLTFAPTGEPVSTELAHFWLFENDRPVEIVEFVDTAWAAQLMLKIA